MADPSAVTSSRRIPGYFLEAEKEAQERLDEQHRFTRRTVGHLYHPDLGDLSSFRRILDCAVGSGVWVKDIIDGGKGLRLGKEVKLHPDCRVDLCDISDESLAKPLPPGSGFFFHDVLVPFPDERRGNYDLIHQRYMIGAIKKDQWLPALKHVMAGLAPGGQLALLEPGVKYEASLAAPATAKAGSLMRSLLGGKGYDVDLTTTLPINLAEAGFVDIRIEDCAWEYGRHCTHLGPDYPDLALWHTQSLWNSKTGVLIPAFVHLFGTDGIPTYEEASEIFDAYFKELETANTKQRLVMVVARKPT